MKMIQSNILLVLAGLALIGPSTLAGQPGRGGSGAGGGGAGQVALTSSETSDLVFMREEEKLARDVYLNLFECWGVPIFANIAASEQAHMDAIKRLLDKYGLADPAGEIGVFSNPELQDLYDLLIYNGSVSLDAGLLVGGLIEEVDIEDLQATIADTTKADLQRVYGNLMDGSENHLRAFAGAIENLTDRPYQAQYLTQEEVDAILGAASIAAIPLAAAMEDPPQAATLEVTIQVSPQNIILKAPVTWITVHAVIPLRSVVPASVTLNGVAARIVTADSRGELVAKFAFGEIAAIVNKPSATMILDATSTDGTPIMGWCEVGVR
jgi:hypothetical protein